MISLSILPPILHHKHQLIFDPEFGGVPERPWLQSGKNRRGRIHGLGDSDVSSQPARKPFILAVYNEYLEQQDSESFTRQLLKWYTVGTLERLARHDLREIRRAAVLAIGFLGDYGSNHALGCALLDKDRNVRMLADNGIRVIWTRDGNEAERKEIQVIIRLNAARIYHDSIERATALIERAPWFAEAWHQRAEAFFAQGRLVESIRDSHQTLEINPYHFVAATSMGKAYLELQNSVSALECFRRSLRLNPDLEGVRAQVVRLTRALEGNC